MKTSMEGVQHRGSACTVDRNVAFLCEEPAAWNVSCAARPLVSRHRRTRICMHCIVSFFHPSYNPSPIPCRYSTVLDVLTPQPQVGFIRTRVHIFYYQCFLGKEKYQWKFIGKYEETHPLHCS
jgi:hypothetical protein